MKRVIVIFCIAVSICMTGCGINNLKVNIKEEDSNESINTDIRDESIYLSYTVFNEENLIGNKVIVQGIVSEINIDKEKNDCIKFVLVQNSGDTIEEYTICCDKKSNLDETKLKDGIALKVFGTIDETSNSENIIVNATLIEYEDGIKQ